MTFMRSIPSVEIVFPSYLACSSKYTSFAVLANPIISTASLSQFRFMVRITKLLSLLHVLILTLADFPLASESGSFSSPVTIFYIVSSSCS
jgi:hypothetical protein